MLAKHWNRLSKVLHTIVDPSSLNVINSQLNTALSIMLSLILL